MNLSHLPHEPLIALIAGILIPVMPGFPKYIIVTRTFSGRTTISGS
ncbi:MAG: hypothetical protein ABSF90_15855 [Syntrophobacteraceae bacterium]|jgi:hypothetical protein